MRSAILFFFTLLVFITSCSDADSKFKQYFVEGEQLYLNNCSNCHHKDGKGLGLVYPPLSPSDYMDKNFDEVLCMMKNGKTGEMIVNGKSYHQPMPGVTELTELEIAEIATYIYNSWGHEKGMIEIKQVTNALQACPAQ
ncbi:MAG: cytochrome c [Cyclobacteriaceae bacterium]|nr:cytochrome c [Cyclobacteriaceae bacterium]